MSNRKPKFTVRLVRILIIAALILILRRVPARLFLVLLEGGGTILIVGSLLYGWHRLSKRLPRNKPRQSISTTPK